MKRSMDRTWLDDAVEQTAPGREPRPDFAAWRRDHAAALDTLAQRGQRYRASRPVWRKVMESKISKWAAAAVLILGVLCLSQILRDTQSPTAPVAEGDPAPDQAPREDPVPVLSLDEELALAQTFRNQGDVAGLLELLHNGRPQTRVLAARYLGELGDVSALSALRRLADRWEGDPAGNPYLQAIEAIEAARQPDAAEPNTAAAPLSSPVREDDEGPLSRQADAASGCRGRVVNRQGHPIARAKVVLFYDGIYTLDDTILAEGLTNDQGVFTLRHGPVFKTVTEHSYHRDECCLIAFHPDHAFGWTKIYPEQQREVYEVVLTEPKEATVVVVDANEVPLPGVRVWVYSAGERAGTDPLFQRGFGVERDLGFNGATTDAQGQARLTHLPRTRCSVYASCPGYAATLAFPGQQRIRLTPGADLSGRIRISEDRLLVGAVVTLAADWRFNRYFWTRTDKQGRFAFRDLPADGWDMSAWAAGKTGSGHYILTAKHDLHAIPEQKLQLQPGGREELDLAVYPDTTLIRCQVVTVDEDRPLSGVRLGGSNAIGNIGGYTDARGMYQIRVLPGRTSLWFHSPPDGVYVLDGQNPPESSLRFEAEGAQMDLVLKTPPIAGYLTDITGAVRYQDSVPFELGTVNAAASKRFDTASTGGNYARSAKWDDQGIFTLKGVPADMQMHFYAEARSRSHIGIGSYSIPYDPQVSLPHIDICMELTQSALVTVLDKQGNPARNTRLQIFPMLGGHWLTRAARYLSTDEEGQLCVDGVVPGLTYHVRDARFDSMQDFSREEQDVWVNTEMVFLPLGSSQTDN